MNASLAQWQDQASVRTVGLKKASSETSDRGAHWYPPEMILHARHPLLARLTVEQKSSLERRYLGRHLRFTEFLEHEVVNQALSQIAKEQSRFHFSAEFREGALKIYIDEAYHAAYSGMLLEELNLDCPKTQTLPFLERLAQLQAVYGRANESLILFTFVTISETLISDTLLKAHKANVIPRVRDFLAVHWKDEAVHAAYFSQFWFQFAAQWTVDERKIVDKIFLKLVFLYFTPEIADIRQEIASYGFSEAETKRIVDETYNVAWERSLLATSAVRPMALAQRVGISTDAFPGER